MECKKKYIILELYPSIIKHRIPIVAIVLFAIYFVLFIFYYLKMIILSIGRNSKEKLKYTFLKNNYNQEIEGPNSFTDFKLSSSDITDSKINEKIEKEKDNVIKTISRNHYRKEAAILLQSLVDQNLIKKEELKNLPLNGKFVIKEEEIYFKEGTGSFEIEITKGYNKPATLTYTLYKKLTNIFTKKEK